jgi:hypothetical protein
LDPPSLFVGIAIVAVCFVVPRLMVSAGQAGDLFAQLFVPPDRALGWPRGVQEGDDPWGWHETAERPSPPPDDDVGRTIVDLADWAEIVDGAAGLRVDVRPVHRTADRAA